MTSQSIARPKPWNTPFWFLLGVMVLCIIEHLIVLNVMIKAQISSLTGATLFMLFLWPLLLLAEAIFYRVVHKRIGERKWVWAHLIFSLFSFALLRLLYVAVLLIAHDVYQSASAFSIMQQLQFYCFWAGAIIGHIFFIVVIVQCFSRNKPQLPDDNSDFLNDLPG
jgi:hypothetical protein